MQPARPGSGPANPTRRTNTVVPLLVSRSAPSHPAEPLLPGPVAGLHRSEGRRTAAAGGPPGVGDGHHRLRPGVLGARPGRTRGADPGAPLRAAARGLPVLPFSQDENDDAVEEVADGSSRSSDRSLALVDYLYVSVTNSTAFSPTGTMPLTTRAELLMSIESIAALITSLLVIARAVSALHRALHPLGRAAARHHLVDGEHFVDAGDREQPGELARRGGSAPLSFPYGRITHHTGTAIGGALRNGEGPVPTPWRRRGRPDPASPSSRLTTTALRLAEGAPESDDSVLVARSDRAGSPDLQLDPHLLAAACGPVSPGRSDPLDDEQSVPVRNLGPVRARARRIRARVGHRDPQDPVVQVEVQAFGAGGVLGGVGEEFGGGQESVGGQGLGAQMPVGQGLPQGVDAQGAGVAGPEVQAAVAGGGGRVVTVRSRCS